MSLRVPSAFAVLVATGMWSSLWLPHIMGEAAWGGGTFSLPFGKLGITPPPARIFRRQGPEVLAPSFLTAAADEIRCVAQSLDIDRGGDRERLETLHGYVASLQAFIDDSSESGMAWHVSNLGKESLALPENASSRTRRFAYRTTFLVHCLVMSGLIMSDGKLRDILLNSVRMLLPPALAKPLADVVRSPGLLPLPSKSTTSRWRVMLDGAFMLWTRRRSNIDAVYYAMVDSSTQGGNDYELIVVASIRKSHLVGLLDLVDSLFACRLEDGDADTATLSEDKSLMEHISRHIRLHRPPPVRLASGRTKLVDKFFVTVYALFLETGTVPSLQALMSSMLVLTSDLGVEFSLTTVQPVDVHQLFPFIDFSRHEEHRFGPERADWDNVDLVPAPNVGFADTISIPGLLHIVHNASNEVLGSMPVVSESIDRLAHVATLLRESATCTRLCETCFGTPVGKHHHAELLGFSGSVYRARWGTVAWCVSQVLGLERILRWGWSKEAYLSATSFANVGPVSAETKVHIEQIDQALCDDFWWSSLRVLDAIYGVVRTSFIWAESCPCHFGEWEFGGNVPAEAKKVWSGCPMRGRRLPELACGDFQEVLKGLLDKKLASLLLSLPASLDPGQRACLAKEFELGRMHFVFVLTLKLAAMEEPPRMIFGIAHHDDAKAKVMLQRCLACPCNHSVFARLQGGEVRAEAEQYLAGSPLMELPTFAEFVGELKFAYAVERLVEGDHARTSRAFKHAPSHSDAFDSLARRMHEIRAVLDDEAGFKELCDLIAEARNPKHLVSLLGLEAHPALADIAHAWDPAFQKVIYRADAYSLHSMQIPKLRLGAPELRAQLTLALPDGVAASASAPHSSSNGGSVVAMLPASVVQADSGNEHQHAASQTFFAIRKAEAQKFLSLRLRDLRDDGPEHVYCVPLQSGAIKTLRGKLSTRIAPSFSARVRPWWEDAGYSSYPPSRMAVATWRRHESICSGSWACSGLQSLTHPRQHQSALNLGTWSPATSGWQCTSPCLWMFGRAVLSWTRARCRVLPVVFLTTSVRCPWCCRPQAWT